MCIRVINPDINLKKVILQFLYGYGYNYTALNNYNSSEEVLVGKREGIFSSRGFTALILAAAIVYLPDRQTLHRPEH